MLDKDTPTEETPDTPAGESGTDGSTDTAADENRSGPTRRRRAAGRPAGPPLATFSAASPPARTALAVADQAPSSAGAVGSTSPEAGPATETTAAKTTGAKTTGAKKSATRKTSAKATAAKATAADTTAADTKDPAPEEEASGPTVTAPVFQAPDASQVRSRRRAASRPAGKPETGEAAPDESSGRGAVDHGASTSAADARAADAATGSGGDKDGVDTSQDASAAPSGTGTGTGDGSDGESSEPGQGSSRRRRRRGGRRRRKSGGADPTDADQKDPQSTDSGAPEAAGPTADRKQKEHGDTQDTGGGTGGDDPAADEGTSASSRRRRRRRRRGEEASAAEDDPANTTVRVRERRAAEDEITSVRGSTRLEAKKQRRREGREAGRRRAPIVSEAEFLARRESVEREMVVRRHNDLTQIAVLEDKVLAEHYVARGSQTSIIGNVYLGRVQNVLPSMEAAFVDIGKGRNAVLYAGEVDWKALGGEGKPRRIEEVLSSGQSVVVQVTKDPVGHKGARLTSQVSLPGRFLVYVPAGNTSGISRKLPDSERGRLKSLLKDIVPEEAGVIVRTAAEGASEEQLTRDVTALTARWEDISRKASGQGPRLLYAEPDLMIKVVRDLYNEDFAGLTVQGDGAWDDVSSYVEHVAPDLGRRLRRWDAAEHDGQDIFAAYRLDEQIAKGLDRKVWLPSGGSLVLDRTEAMTVVDVNTGKFTGSGGNLEETVTKNNLEAAEEIVRQLRLRDIGGIVVIDFIDMVLEDNRDLVLRRLAECLGRDRTRHQVAEVTSLGLVQMTRKRIGTGLLEAFSEPCSCCQGRGLHVRGEPVGEDAGEDDARGRSSRSRGRSRSTAADTADTTDGSSGSPEPGNPRPKPRPRPPEPKGAMPPAPAAGTAEDAAVVPDEPGADDVAAGAGRDSGLNSSPVAADADAAVPAAAGEPDVVPAAAESSVPAPEEEQAPVEDSATGLPEPSATADVAKPKRRRATRKKAAPDPVSADGDTPAPVTVSVAEAGQRDGEAS